MRNLTMLLLSAVVAVLAGSVLVQAEEEAWFDMENCGFCKHLAAEPEMMKTAVWEHHNIANGVISITTVEKEYLDAFRKVQAKMEEAGKKMQMGEQVPMCNMCTALGGLMMKGAKTESVKTERGEVWLITSDDPELVKAIQGWAKHTTDELAKMETMDKAQKD